MYTDRRNDDSFDMLDMILLICWIFGKEEEGDIMIEADSK